MSEKRSFFKGSDTSFGMFYPTDYFVAVFSTLAEARTAEQSIRRAGYAEDEVHVFDGDYVRSDIQERLVDADWVDWLIQKVSIGKESHFWNEDLKAAEHGAAFLAIFCATEDEARRIVTVLKPLGPQSMRRYRAFAIETFDQDLQQAAPAVAVPGNGGAPRNRI